MNTISYIFFIGGIGFLAYTFFKDFKKYLKGNEKISIKLKALKINRMININKLEKNEIIIVSLIVGVILSLSFGYIFCIQHYYKWSKGNLIEVYFKTKQENCTFNYAIAVGTFISIGGLTYLFLNRKNGGTR